MHKTTREQTQIDHQDRSRIAYTVNLYRVWIHKAGVNSPSYEYKRLLCENFLIQLKDQQIHTIIWQEA
jgi:hypothetical protein